MSPLSKPARLQVIGAALTNAIGYLGRGEEGGNNMGPFIDDVLESHGRNWAWCALLARHCYLKALAARYILTAESSWPGLHSDHPSQGVGVELVEEHPWLWRKPPHIDGGRFATMGTPEPGAHRLLVGLGEEGSIFERPELAIPGDLALYMRKGGHHAVIVRLVDQDRLIHTIEGNVGPYPAKVRELIREPQRDRDFKFFATLRRGIK